MFKHLLLFGLVLLIGCEPKNLKHEDFLFNHTRSHLNSNVKRGLDIMHRELADDPDKVIYYFRASLKLDSIFKSSIIIFDSLKTKSSNHSIEKINREISLLDSAMSEVMYEYSSEEFFIYLDSESEVNRETINLLILSVLSIEAIALRELHSEVSTTSCFLPTYETLWIIDKLDFDTTINNEYEAVVTYAELPFRSGMATDLFIDSIVKNGRKVNLEFEIKVLEGRHRLKIHNTKPGKYKWYGGYSFMRPNGRIDTFKLEREFIAN
ncbi:MAG: hypothetical protein ACJASM_001294 [Salibacteraceae bacterium]|jgi:hypothetical protein|tara:strand:- start:194 stop:991 length:798 start_codon:yes stop_codon:yes gene_type:complete